MAPKISLCRWDVACCFTKRGFFLVLKHIHRCMALCLQISTTNYTLHVIYHFLTDIEVDGLSFLNLEEKDIFLMLSGKVGVARKLITLIKRLQDQRSGALVEKVIHIDNNGQLLNCTLDEPCETVVVVENNEVTVTTPQTAAGMSVATFTESPVELPKEATVKPIDSYVPKYSSMIQTLLQTGEIYKEWDRFVEETAYHVLAVGDFSSRGQYEDFGRLMVSKHPSIAHKAMKEPWSFFNKKLSQKVRHIRWKWNVRSKTNAPEKALSSCPKKRKSTLPSIDLNDASQLSIEEAEKTMTTELAKCTKEQDRALLLKAFKSSFKDRRSYIQKMPDSNSAKVLEKYPILKKPYYIEKEFFLMTNNQKETLRKNWETLLSTLDEMFDEPRTNEMDTIMCMERVMEQVKYCSKAKSIAPLISHCQSSSMVLSSKKSEAPRLMVVSNSDGELSACFVLAEGISMEAGQNAREALNLLLFTYYTLDLTYPKQYQLLGFLQHYILNDRSNDFFMCSNYLKFTKTLDEKMRHQEL